MIYGRWRRTCARSELDMHELKQRDEEEAWDLRNEALADRLDAMVDRVVQLRRETPIGRSTYPARTRFRVLWRTRDWLIIALLRDTTLLGVAEHEKFELEAELPMRSPRGTLMDVVAATAILDEALNRRNLAKDLNSAVAAASEK